MANPVVRSRRLFIFSQVRACRDLRCKTSRRRRQGMVEIMSFETWIRERGIGEVECLVPDINGVIRGKVLPANKFLQSEKDGSLRIPSSVYIVTLTGDFEVRDGALAVQTQGTITHPLSASVKFSEAGAPGAEVGPMRVASVDGAMQVFAGGALVGSVRAAADRFHFAVPEAVHFTFDGDAMVHGSTLIRPTASGVMIEEGAVKLTIDLAGAKARTDSLEVELGKGSAVTLSATGLSTVGDDLRVEHASAGFSVTATGLAKKGPLTFKLEEGGASGQLKVTGDGAQGDIRYGLSFRPKVGPVALPAHASLEGEAQVTLLQDAVWVQSANGVRLGL